MQNYIKILIISLAISIIIYNSFLSIAGLIGYHLPHVLYPYNIFLSCILFSVITSSYLSIINIFINEFEIYNDLFILSLIVITTIISIYNNIYEILISILIIPILVYFNTKFIHTFITFNIDKNKKIIYLALLSFILLFILFLSISTLDYIYSPEYTKITLYNIYNYINIFISIIIATIIILKIKSNLFTKKNIYILLLFLILILLFFDLYLLYDLNINENQNNNYFMSIYFSIIIIHIYIIFTISTNNINNIE